MNRNRTHHRGRTVFLCAAICLCMAGLAGRLFFLMLYKADYYSQMAEELHQRERSIKAPRGRILDRNGTVIADNRTVCTISVIHNQVKDPETVIRVLSEELGLPEAEMRKKTEKRSSREVIQSNVEKTRGDAIRAMRLEGVKVDEDYKRYYPYGRLASKVLGFTGGDNQGIIGLEVQYEKYLKGTDGKILTLTDAAGIELENEAEDRIEPEAGRDLQASLDVNIQMYAEQAAYQTMQKKNANRVSIIVMNPKNGEIYAMVNAPEFSLNEPFELVTDGKNEDSETEEDISWKNEVQSHAASAQNKQALLNQMWRNPCLNDTYEPGSTFKIVTAAAGLEAGVVNLTDQFSCPGFRIVEDRKIRCHKVGGHGGETFLQGMMNSCNPVLIDVGQRLGPERYYQYFKQFGLLGKTGIDLPGEAGTIMHQPDQIGPVELATVSFGQSFQITPIQLAATVSSLINGGTRITPHLGLYCEKTDGSERISVQKETEQKRILSEETSARLRSILFQVVENGGGKNGKVEGYQVGGKTATSETLPRGTGRYISSFLGFAPADDPKVLALCIIRNPQGVYYGGLVAAPVVRELFENILPYLDEIGYYEKNETINRK